MTTSLSSNLINKMVEWVDVHIGLKVSDVRLSAFAKGLCLAAADSGFENPHEYIEELLRSPPKEHELGYLASYLTVGETYFFRDPLSFNLLSSRVLPQLCQGGDSIKIWSAGCATGEEPYSIAITSMSSLEANELARLEIIATDINPRYLDIARMGLYRRWSFRDVPAFIKDRYFRLSPDHRYCLSDNVKRVVRFSYLNLASENYPSPVNGTQDVDVIFCRNVLIYFSPEHVTQVLNRFHRALKDGGYLFLAPSEIPHPAPENFRIINVDGAILLRKEGSSSEASEEAVRIVQSNYSYFGQQSGSTMMKSFESLIDVGEEASDGTSTLELPRVSVDETGGADSDYLTAEGEDELATAAELFQKGRYEEVIDLLLDIPSSYEAEVVGDSPVALIARAYANLGNLEAALDWIERLIGAEPLNPRWYYLRATIQQEKGEEGAASISLRQAIFLEPEFVLAHFALGNLHRQSGDQWQAKRCFTQVVDLLKRLESAAEIQDSDGLLAGQLMTIAMSLVEGGG